VIERWWDGSPAVDDDGWLATGDLGRLDADGYLFLEGRSKELIVRGGYNVHPREVEEALHAHPDVVEAVVVGVPDARLGEEVAAAVVVRPGGGATPDALADWARARVAAYKVPRLILVADALPHGPTGKVLRSEVAQLLAGGGPRR
jgi:long-chain acyl-CoA synthetase